MKNIPIVITGNMCNAFEAASGVKISMEDFSNGLIAALANAPGKKITYELWDNDFGLWINISKWDFDIHWDQGSTVRAKSNKDYIPPHIARKWTTITA